MSFPGTKRLGIDFTATNTSAVHKLGEVAWSNTGQRFRYVLAAEAIAVYSPVDWTAAHSASVVDANDAIYGVAQVAIASGSYGWVQESGAATILMTGSQAACAIGRFSAAGAVGSIALETVAGDSAIGVTYAAEAATPAGVSAWLF